MSAAPAQVTVTLPDGKALTFDAELLHSDLHPSSFGEDAKGELYVLDYFNGGVWRITP